MINLDNNTYLSIDKQNVEGYPYALKIKTGDKTIKIDQYAVEGGKPICNGMSITKAGNESIILVQFYWRMRNADYYGSFYETYYYRHNGSSVLENTVLNKDQNFSGFHGYYYNTDGLCEQNIYSYDTIDKITKYFKETYP
ncbi:hypothetical protein BS333_15920 [Vibrio azureus]|uniref:Uncharacterized protein n=1 Tax=Vibrio azureus NBRC 104587 TaxID=1219077 RepID=U3ASP9_9VIBR|nr:hypothetical protein [Vibrio azureus]AUI87880.1 hypothetical protein BS333_15920 [Vibrio azureus]GAD76272.1 hypothetical protein VAZ01S_040_00260 [Vibrio azureus NBRC 104587]